MALNKWKYGIPKKEEPKQTKKMDKAEVFNQTFAPTLPFTVTEPGQRRLDFSSDRTPMTELPKTTQVKAPITGKTFSLDNVKTFNAPKEEIVNNRPLVNDELDRIKKTVKEKFDIDIDKRGKPFQVGEAMKEAKLSDTDKKELARLLVQYETLKVEESPSEQLKTSFVKGFSPVETTKLEKEYLDDPTRYQEALETTASKVGNFGGNLAKYASLYYLAGPAIAGTGGSTAGGVGAGVGTLNTTIAQRLGYTLGTGAVGALTGELAKDVVLGTALGGAEALQQGQKGREVAKTIAQNILMDLGFNLGGVAIGTAFKGFKALDEATKFKTPQMVDEVAKAMNIPTSEASKVIDDEIDFYVNQYGTASPNQFEQLQLPAPEFKPEFKSDTFASTLRNKTNDIYVNRFGVADTKPFEQLQLEAPKNIVSDTSAVMFRDGVQPKKIIEKDTNRGKWFQSDNDIIDIQGRIDNGDIPQIEQIYFKDKFATDPTDFSTVSDSVKGKGNATKELENVIQQFYEKGFDKFRVFVMNNDSQALAKRLEDKGIITAETPYKYEGQDVVYKINKPLQDSPNKQIDSSGIDLYHGTWRKHQGFEPGRDFYFTPDKEFAESFIRQPKEGTDLGGELLQGKLNKNAKILDTRTDEGKRIADEIISSDEYMSYSGIDKYKESKFENGLPKFTADDFIAEAKARGYDGVVLAETLGKEGTTSFRLFNPESIEVKPQLDRPSEFTIGKPQYTPLAKPFAKDVINPVKPILKAPVKEVVKTFDAKKPVFYHGTGSTFDKFNKQMQGGNYRFGENAFFFTNNEKVAGNYAKISAGNTGGKERVIAANLDVKNPLVLGPYDDAVDFYDLHSPDILSEVEQGMHDGVIIKSTSGKRDLHVVFEPEQIIQENSFKPTLGRDFTIQKPDTKAELMPEKFTEIDVKKFVDSIPELERAIDMDNLPLEELSRRLEGYKKVTNYHKSKYEELEKTINELEKTKLTPSTKKQISELNTRKGQHGYQINYIGQDIESLTKRILKLSKEKINLELPNFRDFTIQKPTYPPLAKDFAREVPKPARPRIEPILKPELPKLEEVDPAIKKFRLDLFGAKPTKPIKALLGQNEVEVTSLIKDTATLKDGRVVNVKDLNPVKLVPTLDTKVQDKINATVNATDDQLIKSVNEKIARDIPKKKKTFTEKWNEFKKNVEDDVTYFGKLEKDIKGFIGSAEDSIYKQARLFKGAPETANEFIRTRLAPVLKNIEKKGYSTDDLGDYALMMHAKDVNAEGLNSGFTNQEIEAVLKKYYGNVELETARQELLSISDDLLDQLAKDGLLDTAQLLALKTKWKNYMPLFRAFDDDKVEFARGISDAFSNVTAPIKKLKGSDRNVIDPIESMIKNIYQTTSATMRNRVGLRLAKLAELDVDERFIRKLTDNELVGRKNVVNVTENGKKVAYEVEPEVYKTFNNLDKETSNFLIDVLSKPASVLRAGATLTPEFALRNPFRDIQTAFVNSESGFTPLDFVRGLASSIKKDDLYSQWLKEGGGYGSILSMDRNAHQKVLKDILKQSPGEKFVNIVSGKDLIKALRGISDLTEAATKVGEFGKALKKGASPQEAAYRARDLMDFSRSGSSIRQANKIVAFLNANIQGKSKLIRSIKERPVGTMLKMTTSMTLPTVGFYALNEKIANEKQRQTIDEAPDWLKNTFWLVAIPGTDLVARLPKPFDMSIFANGTERFLDYVKKNDKEAFDGFIKQSIKDQSIPTMISGVVPFFEVMSNYSTFRESPIIPLREQYIKSEDQYDNTTSEIAKLLAGGARKVLGEESKFGSPRAMDYLLKTSTAGLGTTVLDASDWLASTLGISDRPSKAERGITNFPGLKGFLVSETMSGKSVGEVYDLADELQKKKGSLKLNLQAKLGDRYDPADLKATFREQDQLTYLNSITDEMSDISKELRKTNNSTTLTPQEKRKIIEDLTQKRNALAIKAIEKVKEMNK